jgi:hypothetical protein
MRAAKCTGGRLRGVTRSGGKIRASSEKSVGNWYVCRIAGGMSARAAGELDAGQRSLSFFLFVASCLSEPVCLNSQTTSEQQPNETRQRAGKRLRVRRDLPGLRVEKRTRAGVEAAGSVGAATRGCGLDLQRNE